MPDFTQSFLVSFDLEATRFEEFDGIIIAIYCEIDFLRADERIAVLDVFVSHDDLLTFVADASELMRSETEDDTFHEDFWLNKLRPAGFELMTEVVFVNIEKLGFDFGMHEVIIA